MCMRYSDDLKTGLIVFPIPLFTDLSQVRANFLLSFANGASRRVFRSPSGPLSHIYRFLFPNHGLFPLHISDHRGLHSFFSCPLAVDDKRRATVRLKLCELQLICIQKVHLANSGVALLLAILFLSFVCFTRHLLDLLADNAHSNV